MPANELVVALPMPAGELSTPKLVMLLREFRFARYDAPRLVQVHGDIAPALLPRREPLIHTPLVMNLETKYDKAQIQRVPIITIAVPTGIPR
ncbi:MAG TPA: hypothetical protein VGK19_25290 [Capsulimonadaceae bacterium]